MQIDVRDILKASGLAKNVEFESDAEGCGISGDDSECEFTEKFIVTAELTNVKGMIRVKGAVKTGYRTYCARCLKNIRRGIDKAFEYEYVQFGSLGEVTAEDAEVFEYSDKEIDISPAVREAVLLDIPFRHLCGEECLSLCPTCGKDLNEGNCGCVRPEGDIRFEALRALYDKNHGEVIT